MRLFALLAAVSADAPVQFTDITQPARIEFRHELGDPEQVLVETMGGGVALRLRQRWPARRVLHERREDRDPMPASTLPDKADPRFWNRMPRQTQEVPSST